jgi:putative transposase
MLTRVGELTFQVPQVRSGDFYPSAQDGGARTDRAVSLALAEMDVQGVSTRRVIEVLQRLLGPEISLSTAQVSRAVASLDRGFRLGASAHWGTCPICS